MKRAFVTSRIFSFTNNIPVFTRQILVALKWLLVSFSMVLLTGQVQAAETTTSTIAITPNTLNSNASPTGATVVTMGVPLAPCVLTDTNNFRVFDDTVGGSEVEIFIKETLYWNSRSPCGTTSIRAVKVQFLYPGAADTWRWELGARGTTDRTEVTSHDESVTDEAATKSAVMEPDVFAILPPDYLVLTGIIPPTTAAGTDPYDTAPGYFTNNWELDSRDFNWVTSTFANWQYDPTTTVYKQALRRGDLDLYRDAYMRHEFWIDKVQDTGTIKNGSTTGNATSCIGGFDWGSTSRADNSVCDSKYIYTEGAMLHIALTGDDSWIPGSNSVTDAFPDAEKADAMFLQMADEAYGHITPAGFREAFDQVSDNYAERKPGLGLGTMMNSCMIGFNKTFSSAVPDICALVDSSIDWIYDHLQGAYPGGPGNVGYLEHSWFRHEFPQPWIGEVVSGNGTTTLVVDLAIGDASNLKDGDQISISGGGGNYTLGSNPGGEAQDLGGGMWQIEVTSTLTSVSADALVRAGAAATDSNLDLDSDKAFSPWMNVFIADALWLYIQWYKEDTTPAVVTRRQNAEEIIRSLARSNTKYAFDGVRMNPATETLIESAFPGIEIQSFGGGANPVSVVDHCGLTVAPYTRYYASRFMNIPGSQYTSRAFYVLNGFGGTSAQSDVHIPNNLYLLSLGIFLETDAAKKAAMESMAADMLDWFDQYDCTDSIGPPRKFGWQNKPDPFGVYSWVKSFAITYDADTFLESVANDGSITTTLNLTLGGDTFTDAVTDGNPFTGGGTHYTITNLPAGLTAVVTKVDDTSATLALTSNATDHEFADSISDLTLEFEDDAFKTVDAIQVSNSSKNDLAIVYKQPKLTWSASTLNEDVANNGSVLETITITLEDDTFTAGPFNDGDEVNISNIPAGMGVNIARDSDTQLTVSLTGNATAPHNTSVLDFTIEFTDNAFTTFAATGVLDYLMDDLQVLFVDPRLAYAPGTGPFTESNANDGTVPTVINLTLFEDIFADPLLPAHYSVTGTLGGLTGVVTRTGDTTATLTLTGSADPHTNAEDASDLALSFTSAAFQTYSAAAVANSNPTGMTLNFHEPGITVSDGGVFSEAPASDGSIANTLTLTLADDTFAAGPFTSPTHYSVSNIPPGLTPVVTRTGATTATFALTGNATDHANADDVANIGLSFTNAAFSTYPAATIPNAVKTDYAADFSSPSLGFDTTTFVESNANDGMITTVINLTLTEDTFTAGPFTSPTHYTVSGVPAGLTGVVTRTGATTATFALTGTAAAHSNAEDLSNIQLTFTAAAFTGGSAAAIQDSDKNDFGLDFIEPSISYDADTFVEDNSNVGATSTVLTVTLLAETFTAGPFNEGDEFDVNNIPSSFTVDVTRTSGTTATVELTGNADNHANANDVSNLELSFNNAAFTGGDASAVINSTKSDISVDFVDAILSYSDDEFEEAGANDGSIGNSLVLTLTVDTFTAGPFNAGDEYNVSNVPAGLTVSIARDNATTLTVSLTGNAADHEDSDSINNLGLTFTNAAFTNNNAAAVQNSARSDLDVTFEDEVSGLEPPPMMNDLAVMSGSVFFNEGVITNLTNAGTVIGGTLGGQIDNTLGIVANATIAEGAVLNGGVVEGNIMGTGTIENAVLKVSGIDPGVKIGRGTKVTINTAKSVSGINLTGSLRQENGELDLDQPLLVDEDENEISVSALAVEAVNELFENDSTQTNPIGAGSVDITNDSLGNSIVPVIPTNVTTTNEPNGVSLDSDGELIIIRDGIKTSFAPSAVNKEAFDTGMIALGATSNLLSSGLILVEYTGQNFSLRFNILADSPTGDTGNALALSHGTAQFETVPVSNDPLGYRVMVDYPDGSAQELNPSVHDVGSFGAWYEGAGFTYSIDPITGVISIYSDGNLVDRLLPEYVLELPSGAVDEVDIQDIGDVNSDGSPDLLFITPAWEQILYGLPLSN